MKFVLNGCDISFVAEAPADITLEQLLKQCDRIRPSRSSGTEIIISNSGARHDGLTSIVLFSILWLYRKLLMSDWAWLRNATSIQMDSCYIRYRQLTSSFAFRIES